MVKPDSAQPGAHGATIAAMCERYRMPLLRYFIRRGYASDVAEDCVQDVFLRISRSDFSKIDNVEAYLFAVASSAATDQARRMAVRRASQHDSLENHELESREASPARVFEDREALLRLERVLGELKPRTREIFLLNRLDGLSYTQLAARYGLSVAAIEKQMSKALAHLRKRFSRDE